MICMHIKLRRGIVNLPAGQFDGAALGHDDIGRGVLGDKVGRNHDVQVADLERYRIISVLTGE